MLVSRSQVDLPPSLSAFLAHGSSRRRLGLEAFVRGEEEVQQLLVFSLGEMFRVKEEEMLTEFCLQSASNNCSCIDKFSVAGAAKRVSSQIILAVLVQSFSPPYLGLAVAEPVLMARN